MPLKQAEIEQILKAHFAKIGAKGGKSTSKAKAEAARRNAKKPRPKLKTKGVEK